MRYSNQVANPNSLDSLNKYLQDPGHRIINITTPLADAARNQGVIEVPANKTLKIEAGGSLAGIARLRAGSELLVGENGVFNGRVVVEDNARFSVKNGGTFLAADKGYHTNPKRHSLEVHHGGSVHIEPNALIDPMTVYGSGMLNGQRLVKEHRLLVGPNQTLSQLTDPVIAFPGSTIAGTTLTSDHPLYVTPLPQVTDIERMEDGLAIFPVDKAPDPNELRERIQNNGEWINPRDMEIYRMIDEARPPALQPTSQTINAPYDPPNGKLVVGKGGTLHIRPQGVVTGDIHLEAFTKLVVNGTVDGSVEPGQPSDVHITSTGRITGDVNLFGGMLRIDEGGVVQGDVKTYSDFSHVFVSGSVEGQVNVTGDAYVAIDRKGQVGELKSILPNEIEYIDAPRTQWATRFSFSSSKVRSLAFPGARIGNASYSSLYAEAGAQIGMTANNARYSASSNFDAIVMGNPDRELDPSPVKTPLPHQSDRIQAGHSTIWKDTRFMSSYVQDIKKLFGDEHAYVIHPMSSE
ncbi:MAG TPA: polymer-forming cytoskeletal protein [Burkholderiaceae bacterium]|nr:polymer-forming cytoskeletal protein [Burkholderiaceae bacterium]